MKIDTLMNVLEVLIMVSDTPLSAAKLCELVDHHDVTIKEVKLALQELSNIYESRGIGLKKVASGYRFQAKEDYQEWFHKLFSEKPAKYSRALLETLAIVAYRQPVTRADVESIRGVAVSTSIMRTLLERDWVKVVGHRDVPGKPSIYATTKGFLDYFNIAKLDDLPPLSEVKELADIMEQGKQSEVNLKESLDEQQQRLPLEEEMNNDSTEPTTSQEAEEAIESGTDSLDKERIETEQEIMSADDAVEITKTDETIAISSDVIPEERIEEESVSSTFVEKVIEEVTDSTPNESEKEEEVV